MKYKMTRRERDSRRVWWDEKDCERLTRNEYHSLQAMYVTLHFASLGAEDLSRRLECIPYGNVRMRLALGCLRALVEDVIGTMTLKQAKMLRNTLDDTDVRIMPKATPRMINVLTPKETYMELVTCAKEKCKDCSLDDVACRNCRLYQILEATVPLDDYGNGMLCPYNQLDWAENQKEA